MSRIHDELIGGVEAVVVFLIVMLYGALGGPMEPTGENETEIRLDAASAKASARLGLKAEPRDA
jgi:hypothetical protein